MTGGAGYIGSAVVVRLVEDGHHVVVFDDLSTGHAGAVHPGATLVRGDLADRGAVDAAMAEHRPEGILHFASRSLVGESMENPFLYLGDNVRAGLNLLESAAEHGVSRFVLSSTANLYGAPERIPIDEDAPVRPGSPYGESKLALERMLPWMERIYGMRHAVLRYFNACGALSRDHGEDHRPETHLVPVVLQVALGQRESVTVHGQDYDTADGTCVRDYVHVADLADAHALALGAVDGGSRTYNLGNGRGFSVREVIDAVREVTGHAIPVRSGPRRAGDPPVLVASSERIGRELGWHPRRTDLREIVESAWRWHRANPHGFVEERQPAPRTLVRGERLRGRTPAVSAGD